MHVTSSLQDEESKAAFVVLMLEKQGRGGILHCYFNLLNSYFPLKFCSFTESNDHVEVCYFGYMMFILK